MRKKRTVRRPARQASPSSDSTDSVSIPTAAPGPSSPPIDSLAGKIITMGRKVDFSFLEKEGFEIGNQLKSMGWETVCSLDLPTYPALVKDFYSNLGRGDGGLVSSVRGTRIHLTFEILGNILSCPVSGMTANVVDNKGAALSRFLGRDVSEIEEIQANQLPLELRLLHNICSRLLFPKTGHFEYLSERDIVVMNAVITSNPINLLGMIIWYMAECGSKKRATLPYGMILTKVFQAQGVSILESEPKKSLRHTDYYNKATLHRMGFSKINGKWTRKGGKEECSVDVDAGAHSSSEEEPSARHVSPGPSHPTSSAPTSAHPDQSTVKFSDAQLDQIRSLLSVQKEELKSDLNGSLMSLNELFYSLDVKVNKLQSELESSMIDLKDDINQKFDELKELGSYAELKEKIADASTCIEKKIDDLMKNSSEEIKKSFEDLKGK